MPSVYAAWNGQCRDKTKREELYLRMCDLGELAHSFFQPVILIKHFNHSIEGNILISKAHFSSAPTSPKLNKAGDGYYSLEKINLYGVEFKLDSRSFYPGENRISFVFCIDDDPQLDGIVVLVEDRQECLKYVEPVIQQSDYFLETPNIHLRYYLEDWLDLLLGWVKYHYINNLSYWRYADIWTDGKKLNDFYGKFEKYEYYEILKLSLKTQLTEVLDVEQSLDSEIQDSYFRTAIGKLPKEIDDY